MEDLIKKLCVVLSFNRAVVKYIRLSINCEVSEMISDYLVDLLQSLLVYLLCLSFLFIILIVPSLTLWA